MTRRALFPMLFLLVAAAGACASSGGGAAGTNRNVLTREEIATVRVANVYEAVERLRPRWLQIRAPRSLGGQTEIAVFMNRSYLGGPEVLRQFEPTSITQVRYLDGATAMATLAGLGGKVVEGAIIIEVAT
jgi:hypothetical protein